MNEGSVAVVLRYMSAPLSEKKYRLLLKDTIVYVALSFECKQSVFKGQVFSLFIRFISTIILNLLSLSKSGVISLNFKCIIKKIVISE